MVAAMEWYNIEHVESKLDFTKWLPPELLALDPDTSTVREMLTLCQGKHLPWSNDDVGMLGQAIPMLIGCFDFTVCSHKPEMESLRKDFRKQADIVVSWRLNRGDNRQWLEDSLLAFSSSQQEFSSLRLDFEKRKTKVDVSLIGLSRLSEAFLYFSIQAREVHRRLASFLMEVSKRFQPDSCLYEIDMAGQFLVYTRSIRKRSQTNVQ